MELISKESVIGLLNRKILELKGWCDADLGAEFGRLCNEVANIKPEVIIPDDPTNGDVIMAAFPDRDTEQEGVVVSVRGLDCDKRCASPYKHFWADWWNAPYKDGE